MDDLASANHKSAIDYAIISGVLVTVQSARHPDKIISVTVDEIGPDFLILTAHEFKNCEPFDSSLVGTQIHLILSYMRQATMFSIELLRFESHEGNEASRVKLITTLPVIAEHINLRQYPRIKLGVFSEQVTAKFKLLEQGVARQFETRSFYDVSQKSIALFLKKTNGTLCPGDLISQFELFRDNALVLSIPAKVYLVDEARKTRTASDSYFVVLQLGFQYQQFPSREVIAMYKRETERYALFDFKNACIELTHPLFQGPTVSGEIFDLSPSGIAFSLNENKSVFIEGMIFSDFTIRISDVLSLKAVFVVHNIREITEEKGRFLRIGGGLSGMSVETIKQLSRTIKVLRAATIEGDTSQ